jgi:ABC-2 type transport system permease protein
MSAISFFYSFMVGSGLKMFNSLDILPALMMAVTCVIILMTTVFKVKGTVFGFRDYDMVMSLPVSIGGIVASR